VIRTPQPPWFSDREFQQRRGYSTRGDGNIGGRGDPWSGRLSILPRVPSRERTCLIYEAPAMWFSLLRLRSGRFIMATPSRKDAFWPSTSGMMPTPREPSMGSWLEPFMVKKGFPKTGEKRSHITNYSFPLQRCYLHFQGMAIFKICALLIDGFLMQFFPLTYSRSRRKVWDIRLWRNPCRQLQPSRI
jgi:hypothetical protein